MKFDFTLRSGSPDNRKDHRQIPARAIGAAGLAGLLIALMFISQTARATMLEARETKAVKDSAQFSAVLNAKARAEATRDSLYQQIAIIKSIDDSRYMWSHLMYEISNALPQYTWLREVTQTSQPRSVAVADTVKYAASGDTANKTPRQALERDVPKGEAFAPRQRKGREFPLVGHTGRHPGAHPLMNRLMRRRSFRTFNFSQTSCSRGQEVTEVTL